jgi:hypothetical protein
VNCTATKAVNLIEPGTEYEDRWTQVDLRVSKDFKVNATRLQAYLDIYNVGNSGAILTRNNTFGAQWGRPLTIVNSRTLQLGGRWTF